MDKKQPFLTSLKIAIFGLTSAFKEERNFRLQSYIAIVVVIAMVALKLSRIESAILVLIMLLVLSLELINSQIEKFLDLIEPNHHPRVKIIKDFSAGAVLLSALGSVIIGLLIFWPHVIHLL
ncbi:MAG: diacylglycerol kinase family protein [Candidatus Paceibacterales bacterium]